MRAGGQTLTLLGAPRIFLILRSLADGAKGQLELRRDAGAPAQSTLRGHLRALETAGVIEKRRRDSFPGALEYDLTETGGEILEVATSLERWLAAAPSGPIELGGDKAKAAIKGLVDGWSATILTTLAAGPLSLTELDKQISAVSYPTIERCLETMRLAEQLETGARSSRGTPYSITDWLRRGVGPIIAGVRWEYRNRPDGATPLSQEDVDSGFTLAAPLIEMPPRSAGVSQLAARASEGRKQRRFMASFEAQNGAATYGAVYPGREPEAWASGTLEAWFSAVIDGETGGLKVSGDRELGGALIDGLHEALFSGETSGVAAVA